MGRFKDFWKGSDNPPVITGRAYVIEDDDMPNTPEFQERVDSFFGPRGENIPDIVKALTAPKVEVSADTQIIEPTPGQEDPFLKASREAVKSLNILKLFTNDEDRSSDDVASNRIDSNLRLGADLKDAYRHGNVSWLTSDATLEQEPSTAAAEPEPALEITRDYRQMSAAELANELIKSARLRQAWDEIGEEWKNEASKSS